VHHLLFPEARYRWIEEQSLLVEEQCATLEQMLCDLSERQSFLRAAQRPLLALDLRIQPSDSDVEEIRGLLNPPESRVYFQVGEIAPWRGLYSVSHRTQQCRLAMRTMFIEAGAMFPRCFQCGNSALYRVLQRFV
jgi:hypothetical protein